MVSKAVYPGSFDPITNGHVDIVERALGVFDEITILLASSVRKSALLSADERMELIRGVFRGKRRVKVERWDGLLMDYARKHRVRAVIRGLRAASDFEYEFMMAAMNKQLYPDIETFFMMSGVNLYFISSSVVRELFHFGGDVAPYVPATVSRYLLSKRKAGEL